MRTLQHKTLLTKFGRWGLKIKKQKIITQLAIRNFNKSGVHEVKQSQNLKYESRFYNFESKEFLNFGQILKQIYCLF